MLQILNLKLDCYGENEVNPGGGRGFRSHSGAPEEHVTFLSRVTIIRYKYVQHVSAGSISFYFNCVLSRGGAGGEDWLAGIIPPQPV